MAPSYTFTVPQRDLRADLEFIESMLAQVMLLPRTVPRTIAEGMHAFEAEFKAAAAEDAAICRDLDAVRAKPDSKHEEEWLLAGLKVVRERPARILAEQVGFLEAEFGKPYIELKRLLRQDTEDNTGRRMEVESLLLRYRSKPAHPEPVADTNFLYIDGWAGKLDHGKGRRLLADLIIDARAGVWNQLRTVANPDAPTPESEPSANWSETPQGWVTIRMGRATCTIKVRRYVWLFCEVARAKGQPLTWDDLVMRWLSHLASTRRERQAGRESIEADTMRHYGDELRTKLRGFASMWKQDGDGARWLGDGQPTA